MIRILLCILLTFTITGVRATAVSRDSNEFATGQPGARTVDDILKPVLIITREDIQRSNAANLAELLKYHLNFSVIYLGRNGYDGLYLGGDRKNLKVLMDGIPMFTNAHDRVDFNTITLYNVDRIEIVKGSYSAIWGTDAVTLVINIITLDMGGEYLQTMSGFHLSRPGYYDAKAKVQINTARHTFNVFGSRSFFGGFQGIDSNRVMQWKPLLNYNFNAGYTYTIMRGIQAFAWADYSWQKVQDRNYPIPNTSRARDYELNVKRGLYVAGIRGQLSKYHHYRFDQSVTTWRQMNRQYMKQLTDLEERRISVTEPSDSLNYRQYRTSMVLSKTPENKLGYVTGMEFTHQEDKVVGVRNAIKTTITEMSFFGGMQYVHNDQIEMDASLRLSGSSKFRTPPVFDGNLKYMITEAAFFNVSYSRSYRTPSWNELFYIYDRPDINIQGNLNLRSETTNTFFWRFDILSEHIDFRFSLFFLNTRNGIELAVKDKERNAYQFVNTRHFKSIGNMVEVDGDFRYTNFEFGISNTGVNRFPERVGNYNFTIEIIGNVTQKIPHTNFEIWILNKMVTAHTDFFENEDGVLEEQQLDGYAYCDLGMSYRIKSAGLLISFGCKNIFDTRNTSGLYLPVERLNDEQVNRRIPVALDYGRRWWTSVLWEI